MVEFISYTGKFPNLCRGVLTLKVDEEEVRFGHDYSVFESRKTDGNYDRFWFSGGGCVFCEEPCVNYGEWEINMDMLPDEYKKYADEIADVFNSNVQYGCCGGCL